MKVKKDRQTYGREKEELEMVVVVKEEEMGECDSVTALLSKQLVSESTNDESRVLVRVRRAVYRQTRSCVKVSL